jgi:hypothetical protein
VVVVELDEDVDEGLQLVGRGGLDGLGMQPLLHGLLEAFDLAAGGWVVSFRSRKISSTLGTANACGEVFGRRDRGSSAASPLGAVSDHELADPALRHPVGLGDLGLLGFSWTTAVMTKRALDIPERCRSELSYVLRHAFPMS